MSVKALTPETFEAKFRNPKVSGDEVVWASKVDGNWDVYRWKEWDIVNASNDPERQEKPSISGSRIVWQHLDATGPGGGDWEIYYYNGVTMSPITSNESDDTNPVVSGAKVAWVGEDGIYLWDGTVTNISGICSTCTAPAISGSRVVWTAFDGNDGEIYQWDGVGITQITDNSIQDRDPSIAGKKVVWEGDLGIGSSSTEIFYWDGETIYQVTNNQHTDSDPHISGSSIVWVGDENYDQIFRAQPLGGVPAMSPGILLVVATSIGLLGFQLLSGGRRPRLPRRVRPPLRSPPDGREPSCVVMPDKTR